MALTPYPSLATLPEVIVNGGKVPAHTIDVFAARTVYASSIPGVVLDCNLFTGLTAAGGTPTDNAAKINAVLATATANNPVHLVIDGGCAIGKALLIPSTGHVTITGHGWATGFFVLSGSNSNAIQNVAGTDLGSYQAWNPGIGPTANRGQNVTLSNFRVHCNRGTYPTGNCNGGIDHTLDGYSGPGPAPGYNPDARGSYTGSWFLTGLLFVGIDNLVMEKVWVYDPPTFHVNLYACTNFAIRDCRIQAAVPTFTGNTDGIHINGGCSGFSITGCSFATGDDAIGINFDEGNGQPGQDIVIDNIILNGCLNAGRIYGLDNGITHRISITNVRGTVQNSGFNIGYEGGGPDLSEVNHSVYVGNVELAFTNNDGTRNAIVWINSSAAFVHVDNCGFVDPTIACPIVKMNTNAPVVSSLRITNPRIHRSPSGSAASWVFEGTHGTVGDLNIDGVSVTETVGQSYTDIPSLINLNGTTVGSLTASGKVKGVGSFVNVTSSSTCGPIDVPDLTHQSNAASPAAYSLVVAAGSAVPVSVGRYRGVNLAGIASGAVTLSGPGLVGLSIPDSLMGNNWHYYSATQNAPSIKLAGAVKTYNLTASSNLTPGVATPGSTGSGTAAATATEASLGTGPYSHQWFRSTTPSVLGSSVSGQTTPILSDTGLTPSTSYYYTLRYTDSVSAVVYSNQITVTTTSGSTTFLQDGFTGTPGTSIVGRVPDTHQNGSDVWADGSALGAEGILAVAGSGTGVTSSGTTATTAWSASYALTGVTGGVATYAIAHVSSSASDIVSNYFRVSSSGFTDAVAVDMNYSTQQISLTVIAGGSTVVGPTTQSVTLATGVTNTVGLILGNTTVSVSLNGTPIFTGVTIPSAPSLSKMYLRQVLGSAAGVKFTSVNVHS